MTSKFETVSLPAGPYGWRYTVKQAAELLDAIDVHGGLRSGGEQYPNAICCVEYAASLRALLLMASTETAKAKPEYRLVSSSVQNRYAFQAEINELLSAGWELHGATENMTSRVDGHNCSIITQAMIKK